MKNLYTLLFVGLLTMTGCTKKENHLKDALPDKPNWEDTAGIKRTAAYRSIGIALPQVGYLLQAYDIPYDTALAAILHSSVPSALRGNDIESYVDWIILQQGVITCETGWHELTQEYFSLKTDTLVSRAIRRSLYRFEDTSALIMHKTTSDLANVTFGVMTDGSIGAVYAGGQPITLPEVVVTAVVYGTSFGGSDAPGRGGPSFHPGAALARAREEMRKKAMKARDDFEARARQDQGRRPPQVKGADIVKCFDDGKAVKEYRLTVYIDQPVAGKSDAMNLANGDVGHTFIGLEKINMDGSRVSRTFGFYPIDEGKEAVYSKGILRNNQTQAYDLSVTRTFKDQTSMNLVTQKIKALDSENYLLYSKTINGTFRQSFNCTDAAIGIATAGGMSMPSAFGMFFGPFLPGSCPGKLGDEVRKNSNNLTTDNLGQKSQSCNTKGGTSPKDEGCK